ncbi:MAG TPA: hypothetical protein VJU77_13140 [Chthoniobacterales bacterium]|nr:hypothetical protein [Chthoniobacterales bacterium]
MKRSLLIAGVWALSAFVSALPVSAGETKVDENGTTTAEEESSATNWVELTIGGLSIKGDDAQFKQQQRLSGDVFGGISDLHYETTMDKGTLTVDGHAFFGLHDYDVTVGFTQTDVGYVRAGYTEFRTWYDGNGGFFPGNGLWFPPTSPEDRLDRGEAWIELGLRIPKWPEITFHYSHIFRDGRKDSTIWGDSNLTGLTSNSGRKIAPAFRDIDESRHVFSLDINHTIGNTDLGAGMRYEHSEQNDRLQLWRGAGQLPPVVAPPGAQRFITQRDQNDADSFNGHFTVETRLSDTLLATAAYSYTSLDADISGTRIIGSDYDSMYGDPILTLQSNDHGTLNLAGMSESREHIGNFNLMWIPIKNLSLLAGFRYTHQDKDMFATFLDTNTTANVAPFSPTNPMGGFHNIPNPTPRESDSTNEFDNLGETFEMRYTGLDNWAFYLRGDWNEEWGNIHEHEASNGVDGGIENKDTELFYQKYIIGLNWYPLAELNFAAQYYHKNTDYENTFLSEGGLPPIETSEKNQRLRHQEWDTDDFNIRLTWRPKVPQAAGTVSLVTRYDYVKTNLDSQWAVSTTGAGPVFDELRTGIITQHIVSESITWNPTARLYFQGSFSYVKDETDTPADIILTGNTLPSIVDSQNDYWTANAAMGFALDGKTDFHAEYSYYRADNYEGTSIVGMPYGAGATQHTVGASISREIMRNVRVKLQYGYYHYRDETSGGHNDYEAHTIFSSLLFRF